jgi:hypothetical protein
MTHEPEKTGYKKMKIRRDFIQIEKLLPIINGLGVICGGYARYVCSTKKKPELPGDIDIFPISQKGYDELLIKFKSLKMTIRKENDVAISYRNNKKLSNLSIQMIKPVQEARIMTLGSAEEILNNFDFTVTRCAILTEKMCLVDVYFKADDIANRLRLRNIHCPVSSLLRVCKYARKGFWIPARQAVKLFADWDGRSPEYKAKILDFFVKNEFTQAEVDLLEKLMRID